MKKTAVVIAFAVLTGTAVAQDSLPHGPPAQPDGGWTTEDARTEPHRPSLSYLVATVVRISLVPRNNRFIVTLDNGQRWRQIENKDDVKISIGDQIKLQKSSIGSFMLSTADGIQTRVKRDR
jgi:hypothetical protein